MTEEKAKVKKPAIKTCVALRNLSTSKGNVKKGISFTCSAKEYEAFKKAKAV